MASIVASLFFFGVFGPTSIAIVPAIMYATGNIKLLKIIKYSKNEKHKILNAKNRPKLIFTRPNKNKAS